MLSRFMTKEVKAALTFKEASKLGDINTREAPFRFAIEGQFSEQAHGESVAGVPSDPP